VVVALLLKSVREFEGSGRQGFRFCLAVGGLSRLRQIVKFWGYIGMVGIANCQPSSVEFHIHHAQSQRSINRSLLPYNDRRYLQTQNGCQANAAVVWQPIPRLRIPVGA
jgi:hypothetical protein